MESLKEQVKKAFETEAPGRKRYALMLFETELNLGISNKPNTWVNYGNRFYTRGFDALEAYSNTRCPASQLIAGTTPEELENEMNEMIEHFKDEKWLETELYPCL